MRKKKNLAPRLEAVDDWIVAQPESFAGKWRQGYAGLWVELGCGMGRFAAKNAAACPGVLHIGVERVPEALVVAAEKAKAGNLTNLRFIGQDACMMDSWFEQNEIDRLYIQFCDPWHKAKQAKRRLTYRAFLNRYAKLLAHDGQLWFKSDNSMLTEFTIAELEFCGWTLLSVSRDWHSDPNRNADDIMTEYEAKFSELGQPIGRIVATPPR